MTSFSLCFPLLQSPVRYDSFESLSLSIPLPQWVSQTKKKPTRKTYVIKSCFHIWTRLVMLKFAFLQGRAMSLDQCLQHFISSETIKEVECENCTKVQSLLLLYSASCDIGFYSCATNWKLNKGQVKFTCLFSQLQQGTTVTGVLESQRTTFVKQLKLGKVIKQVSWDVWN